MFISKKYGKMSNQTFIQYLNLIIPNNTNLNDKTSEKFVVKLDEK